jgi:hypothetical protein
VPQSRRRVKPRAAFSSNRRRFPGITAGFKSGLEKALAAQLKAAGVPSEYESESIEYIDPRTHKYTPDFPLPNGIYIESKGYFEPADRAKHLLIQKQHPNLDIRFVFQNPNSYIASAAQRKAREEKAKAAGKPPPIHTTYADWCREHGFKFAAKRIPEEWLKEKPKCT